jgi:16S rRNA (uracil1498-N3)-methyltransferase
VRAAYLPELDSRETYELTGDIVHHLVSVVRVEKDEELLLLNGKGLQVKTVIIDVAKKSLRLKKISEVKSVTQFEFDLILVVPKKEALELSLKQAVELGFSRITLVRGQYSQTKVPEADRLQSLLVSALEQSNSAFLPEIMELKWEQILWNDYGTVLHLDSQTEKSAAARKLKGKTALVVGPEGGFSPEELTFLRNLPNAEALHLPTPILRTPTAVAAGAGVILQRLMS